MSVKFNIKPYFDDFETATSVDDLSPKEKYHKILFRPSHAVQARELTQIQSVLQNQVTQVGNHLFKEGAMVIPGHVSASTTVDYIKLQSSSAADLSSLIGLTIAAYNTGTSNLTTNLKALVVAVAPASGSDPDTIYLQYENSGDGQEKVFAASEHLKDIGASGYSMQVATGTPAGFGSVAFLESGIYFIKGNFVVVQKEQLIIEKYGSTPTYDVGLKITESIITSAEDTSLNDNANGTSNYAAPGAHRYQIKTSLVAQAIGTDIAGTDDDFVLLIQIDGGTIISHVRSTDYSVIEKTLARRTFDESGNYTVRHFGIDLKEDTDINSPGDATKLSVGLDPSKAYVQGYEIETLSTIRVPLDKAREASLFEAAALPVLIGNYIDVTAMEGMPDLSTFETTELYDGLNKTGSIIGWVRIRSIERLTEGTSGNSYADATFRVYLFDVVMNTGDLFTDAKSIYNSDNPAFQANIVLSSSNKAVIKTPQRNSMVFKLPFDRVKTCDSQPDGVTADFNYVYDVVKEIGTATAASSQVTYSTVGATETFNPWSFGEWILTVVTAGSGGSATGSIIHLTSANVAIASGSGSVVISVSEPDGTILKLIAGTRRSAIHKMKSLVHSGNIANEQLEAITTPTSHMTLERADGYKLLAVYDSEDPAVNAASDGSHPDVKEYYDFDNGHKDNYYDMTSIKIKPATQFTPKGRLLIKYSYFTHESGDFFSVDSYDGVIPYEDIPKFVSSNTGDEIELRSAIDFRPRMKNTGGAFDDGAHGVGDGASISTCPKPSTTFTTDVQYYLNRLDKIVVDSKGNFNVIKGVAALDPELPDSPKESMVLYQMYVPAYTFTPEEVIPRLIDNKRYTMRDIGKLEKRIDNLEYYTSLSLLESEAANKDIIDSATQTTRLKAGFLVDSFNTHNVGNVHSPEYRAAMDRDNHRLRCLFHEKNAGLKYSVTNSANVQRTGDLITLPYSETTLFNQNKASSTINVNPYEVFEWTGTVELSPSTDEWKDTENRPELVVNQVGIYDAMMSIIDATDAMGTQWNSWQTNWTGVDVSSVNTGGRNWNRTVTTTITTEEQSRTGIETFNAPDTILTDIGERVVEVNFAPFTRARYVSFKASRLKPDTKVYAFFDGIDINDWAREDTVTVPFAGTEAEVVAAMTTNYGASVAGTGDTAHPQGATDLITNASGEIIGSFWIPNTDVIRFKSGTRVFRLTDDLNNSRATETTSASTQYIARGLIETKENVTISTRVPMLEQREVFEDRIVVNTDVRTNTQWWDPLAQSFLLDSDKQPQGGFITSLELYFHKKAAAIPVTLQIREMDQGLPTARIVPFSEVTLLPSAVSVVDLSVSNPSPDEVTKFTFPSPVYLQSGQEYCFVLMANTTEYEVWFAGIGEDNYTTGKRISKQPYAGVLFTSQNASTWTPDQNKDLKFKINRAEFDITQTSNLILENIDLPTVRLIKNALKTTLDSDEVRVFHKNHGFMETANSVTSKVTISGVTGSTVNGIPVADLNGIHVVKDVEQDSYVIETGSTLTPAGTVTAGIGGGTDMYATQNVLFNTFYPSVQLLNFPVTNVTWGVKMSSGSSLGDATTTPYIPESAYSPVIVNRNFSTTKPRVIASTDNKSSKTFTLRGTLVSTSDYVSPIIDLERCSVIGIQNRIDNPVASGSTNGFNVVDGFVAETVSEGGSSLAKYLTKNIQLGNASDEIRLFIDVNRPSQTYVDVYYRSHTDIELIDSEDWILGTPLEGIPYSDQDNSFHEVEFNIVPTELFSVFAIKIVLKSSNSSRIPVCRDLRAIATKA
jgi:hypothetical protein